ncbi:MAG TPA: type II secretion system protein [Patescibacteria group bacterium]|nr:type II secretion system protein [Patescibacteria group bacterium]
MLKRYKGFTLIELLVVIGILGILLAIVLIAINPARQFAQANNTARRSDVNTILNAIHQYGADNKGKLPTNMPAKGAAAVTIAWDGTSTHTGDICGDISPTYVAQLPTDPKLNVAAVSVCTAAYNTDYSVAVDTSGRVTVSAADAEAIGGVTPVISVTR